MRSPCSTARDHVTVNNAQRPAQKDAPRRSAKGVDAVPFNPPGALLRAATGQQGGES
jgi:hypothetical protein